ncbi:MAG: magnesium transporter CorA family protein [Chitinophagales bacterium]|nr:magnesium transporter CorA family protein [Chitinophagales bacterium]
MVVYLKRENGSLTRLNGPEKGCWIHLYGPFGTEETQKLSTQLSIDIDFITDTLDIDERSRYESEDGVDLMVLKTPIPNDGISDIEASYITIPIGIIRTSDYLITISAYKNQVIEFFLNTPPKNFNPSDTEGAILAIFERNVTMFQLFLRSINNERYAYEKALYKSSSNNDLTKLLNIQKSLIYFVTNLRFNDLLLLKIQRTNFLKIKDEDKMDLLADVIIENQQALSMSEMYSDILNGTMDAFASIISNNLNEIMKRLTSVTILLTVPMLIASFYGMNVRLPGEDQPYSFVFVFGLCIVISGLMGYFFVKKKWF